VILFSKTIYLVTSKTIRNQIRTHAQGLLSFFFWVIVDALIFPAIA
jgi:hypothetical protein